ncbi:hypothetical protein Tco_1225824, partial [Tanacetum coccineum]
DIEMGKRRGGVVSRQQWQFLLT